MSLLGLMSAPKSFNAVIYMSFLAWELHCEGISHSIHYLDDFLVFRPPSSSIAAITRAHVGAVLNHTEAPHAHHKTKGPTTSLTFLGIQTGTELLQLRLHSEELSCLPATSLEDGLLHQERSQINVVSPFPCGYCYSSWS